MDPKRALFCFLLLFCIYTGFRSGGISTSAGKFFTIASNTGHETFNKVQECLTGESAGTIPATAATSAVVMDVASRRVLYAKNPHIRLPMASTTKIMTAILAIEMGDLDDVVTVSPRAVGIEGSSIYLGKGEKLTLEDLLYGLMLRSGNDAAVAIAEHIGGTVENFVNLMNRKAFQIGAKNTNFVNPHGLHDDNHYTTAYDLALISAYAMENPVFRTIASTKRKTIPWEGRNYSRVLQNKNALLWDYEGANGIKTGYTKKSGRCLASAALRFDMQLVCIVLNCQPWFEDSMALLNFCFTNFKPHTVISEGQVLGKVSVVDGFESSVDVISGEDVVLPVKEGEAGKIKIRAYLPSFIKAPVKAGKKVGYVEIYLGSDVRIRKALYTASGVKENTFISNFKRIIDKWLKCGLCSKKTANRPQIWQFRGC
jgi:D-alanyl-D-alanine carboxypeptidase (penicillin-binding protein 5/6)